MESVPPRQDYRNTHLLLGSCVDFDIHRRWKSTFEVMLISSVYRHSGVVRYTPTLLLSRNVRLRRTLRTVCHGKDKHFHRRW